MQYYSDTSTDDTDDTFEQSDSESESSGNFTFDTSDSGNESDQEPENPQFAHLSQKMKRLFADFETIIHEDTDTKPFKGYFDSALSFTDGQDIIRGKIDVKMKWEKHLSCYCEFYIFYDNGDTVVDDQFDEDNTDQELKEKVIFSFKKRMLKLNSKFLFIHNVFEKVLTLTPALLRNFVTEYQFENKYNPSNQCYHFTGLFMLKRYESEFKEFYAITISYQIYDKNFIVSCNFMGVTDIPCGEEFEKNPIGVLSERIRSALERSSMGNGLNLFAPLKPETLWPVILRLTSMMELCSNHKDLEMQ